MAYERPKGLHEQAYTNGELSVHFYRQLYLLRDALLRSVHDPNHFPDLFRALRVLVIDGNRGRLGHLARKLNLHHGVPSMLSDVPVGESLPPRDGPDEWRWFRFGATATLFMNPCSPWFKLRGLDIDPPEPCRETDFWVYLEDEIISNKAEYGAPISRAALIAEVCNARDVVHASLNYPTFLIGAQAWGLTAPYFLEAAQEVAFEVLKFGQRVLEGAQDQYSDQIESALRKAIPIPPALCTRCRLPVGSLHEFVCDKCGHHMLPDPPRMPLVDRLSSIFRHTDAVDQPEGTVAVYLDLAIMHGSPLAEVELVREDGHTGAFRITRTGTGLLKWTISNVEGTRDAVWDLRDSPTEGRAMFFFRWGLDEMSIASQTADGRLVEVTESGDKRELEADSES